MVFGIADVQVFILFEGKSEVTLFLATVFYVLGE